MKPPPISATTVLGIDPGLATTGWGVVEKNTSQPRLIAFGSIETTAGRRLSDRLCTIRKDLDRLIDTYHPSVMAIEELFFTKFAVSIAGTAQARGVILLAAAERGLALAEYNPRSVKVAMTGFGDADKLQMQTMIQRVFHLTEIPRPDDAADAVAIALCHLQTNQNLRVSEKASEPVKDGRSLTRLIAHSLNHRPL